MNTIQINEYLKEIKSFGGTFPCNFIPHPRRKPASFVVNLDRYDSKKTGLQGSHWVVILIQRDGAGIYFDCSGMPPMQPDILKFLESNCPHGFKFSNQTLQDPTSDVCGVYCIDFIYAIARGASLKQYLSGFTSSYPLNDRLVVDRVTCLSSTSQRRSALNLKTLL